MRPNTPLHHVVIIGGGFGGLYAAKALRGAPVRVTLVDRRNFHIPPNYVVEPQHPS
jgi:NADH dehydrogenase